MFVDIGRNERALRDNLQPTVACAVERGADQLGRRAVTCHRLGDQRMGEDDRVALHLIRRDRAVAADGQLEFLLGLVVADCFHARRLAPGTRLHARTRGKHLVILEVQRYM